ncbi:uncharacterized protein LOC111345829 isoform X1 [Stylophora pistillata]|uniref:uncharacterized protein LOC111345829 isoform X1 n=1 Tax=Stylophora pistillata TaxID=50429 RepID=UPI000C04BD60|nr:uncharacterized protein LOC111345829 isoform X1 [Stylophora pistillata]
MLLTHKGAKFAIYYKDSEQQTGQDVSDQQNPNPQQDPFFGGSGENSSSFLPGSSLGSVPDNNGSRRHGAGNHTNNMEKRKSDSVNKDNNGCVTFTSSYSQGARRENARKLSANQYISPEALRYKSMAPSSEYTEGKMNHYKLNHIVFEVIPEGLREIFKREWDNRYGETLGEWKDEPKNGKDFWNLESPPNRKRNFRRSGTFRNGKRAEWDVPMLCHAILSIDSLDSLDPTVKSSVEDLRNVRNEFAHSLQAEISIKDFQSTILRIKDAFQVLGLREPKIPEIGPKEDTRILLKKIDDIEKKLEELELKHQQKGNEFEIMSEEER